MSDSKEEYLAQIVIADFEFVSFKASPNEEECQAKTYSEDEYRAEIEKLQDQVKVLKMSILELIEKNEQLRRSFADYSWSRPCHNGIVTSSGQIMLTE